MRRALLAALLGVVLAPGLARAGGPGMLIGTNDQSMLANTLVAAKANLELAQLAGLDAVNVTEYWRPGLTEPQPRDTAPIGNLVKAANLLGMPVYLSIAPNRGRDAPTTELDRQDFTRFATATAKAFPSVHKYIVGNEPNKNQFWSPQFADDGSDAAAFTYELALADVYDALKGVSRQNIVIGGAVSPRGGDNPKAVSLTHSPVTFIRDLGIAYRSTARPLPIMDWFSFHPYQDNSSQLPSFQHKYANTITLNDYGKLVRTLGQAFDGTAQPGSKIPIVYAEYGIETTIPSSKSGKYTGTEPKPTKPVSPEVQGERYRQALQIAFCQPTVKAFFLFRTFDEAALARWQSGLYYVDHKAKPSLTEFRRAAQETARGVVAHCAGLKLPIRAQVSFPSPLTVSVRCDLDCSYTADLVSSRKVVVASADGRAIGQTSKLVRIRAGKTKAGPYRLRVTLAAAVNPGRPQTRWSPAFRLP